MPASNTSSTHSRIPPGRSSSETASTPQKRSSRMASSGHISTRSDASIMTHSGSVDPNYSTPARPTSSAGMSSASSTAYSRADTPDYYGHGRPESISPVSAAASSPGAAAGADWGDGTIKSRKEGAAAMQRSGSKRSIKPRYGSTYTSPYAQSELAKIVMTPEGNIPIEQYIAYKPQFDENGNLIPFTIPQPPQPPPLKPDPKRESMGRKKLSLESFSRLRSSDKDKDKSKDRSGGHDHGEVPVTPPATALSHSSSSTKNSSSLGQSTAPSTPASSIGGNPTTKGTVPISTSPGVVEFERKHSKSKNSSLTDLGQSLLGRFTSGHHSSSPGSAHSNDRDVSPAAGKEKKIKKEKEKEKDKDKDAAGASDRKPSKRDRIRKMFSRRSGSDGGSGLQSTISAEDLMHGEYILPSNSSIGSFETRDIDLRSRKSAESLSSNLDISPRPKMVARDERLSLNGGRSREELRHMRSTSTGSFWGPRNLSGLGEVESDEERVQKEVDKKQEPEMEMEVVEETKLGKPGPEERKPQEKETQTAPLPPAAPEPAPEPAPISIPTTAPPAPVSVPTTALSAPISIPTSGPQVSSPPPGAMEIGSPKRKVPRMMGSMESMIPVPNKSVRRVGSMSMSSLGSIISANASTTSINTTVSTPSTPNKDKSRSRTITSPISKDRSVSMSTPKDRSQSPATTSSSNSATSSSPIKRTLPRPATNLTPSKSLNQSPGVNSAKSKAMKYGALNDDANATIRPRIVKARKPSAAMTGLVPGDDVVGGRARSNSLPSGRRSGYNSEESEEESPSVEIKRRSASQMFVYKGKQKEVVQMEPLGEIKMPMTPPPPMEVEEKVKETVEKVEEKLEDKLGTVEKEERTEQKVEDALEEKLEKMKEKLEENVAEKMEEVIEAKYTEPPPVVEEKKVAEVEAVVVEESAVATKVEEPEYEIINHPQATPSPEKEEVEQKAPEPEPEKEVQGGTKPTPEEVALPMSPKSLSPVVLPLSPAPLSVVIPSPSPLSPVVLPLSITSPISPIQPAKDFPTLNNNPSLSFQASEDAPIIKKKPSLTLQEDFPTLNRKPSIVKQEIDKWEKMMQETTSSSSRDGEKRKSFESNVSSGWTTDEDSVLVETEQEIKKDTVGQSVAAISEEEKAQQEKVDRVAKEVHMLIDETEKEVRKHAMEAEEEQSAEEFDVEEESTPTTVLPVTPNEVPTSPRVVSYPISLPASPRAIPLPSSLPVSPRSIPTSPRDVPTSPKRIVRDILFDSLDQVLGSPQILPLSPKIVPTSPKVTAGDIAAGSLGGPLESPKNLPSSPKTFPISPKIIPAREVPVESLDNVLEKIETGTLESYLSPRLVPLRSPDGKEQEIEENEEYEEEEQGQEEEQEEEDVYDSDEEGSVIYRSEKVAGSVTLESSPSNSSVYEHPIPRSRTSELEEEEEGTEEDEMEDIEEADEEEDEEETRKLEKGKAIAEGREPQTQKRKVELCTIATQTDVVSSSPHPPPPGSSISAEKVRELGKDTTIESTQELFIAHASNQQIQARMGGLTAEMKAELLELINEHSRKLDEQRRRERLERRASRRNISVTVEVDSTRASESSGSSDEERVEEVIVEAATNIPMPAEIARVEPVPVVVPLVPAPAEVALVPVEVPAPVEGLSIPSEALAPAITPKPTISTITKEIHHHYITYIPNADPLYWLKVLSFLLLVILVVVHKYYDMQHKHLHECGYPPEEKCFCLPELWLGEEICQCVFWPRMC